MSGASRRDGRRGPVWGPRVLAGRIASAAPSAKRCGLRDPKRLPSPSAPRDRLSPAPLSRARHQLAVLPPPNRLPTLLRSSALSLGGARRQDAPRALHPRMPAAARRLTTSATEYDPRSRPLDRPDLAHHQCGRPRWQLFFASSRWKPAVGASCEWLCREARPAEVSRARGVDAGEPARQHLPPRSLANESFAPT